MKKSAYILGGLMAATLLGGCNWFKSNSSKRENIANPTPLTELSPTLAVKEVWNRGLGKGSGKSGIHQSPAVLDGKLYSANIDGEVMAIEAASGRVLWKQDFKKMRFAGAGVGSGLVVVGGLDGDVIAMDAGNGGERWRARVSAEVVAQPTIGGDTVFVRCNDGRVYALDVADGKQRWVNDRATVPLLSLRGNATPRLAGDLLLNATDAGKVSALRSSDGASAWEQNVGSGEGRTEVERLGDVDGDLKIDGDVIYAAAYHGQVVALSLNTGRPIWNRALSSYANVDVSASQVYAVDEQGNVWALDRTSGASMWKQDAFLNRWLSGPAVQGDYVVVGDIEGYVHWLAIADGKEAGRARLSKQAIRATPVVIGDTVYVVDVKGELGAFRAQL
ncbi:Beta-barrel assembly machine subunit BamB [Tahibacter aquaticus]|uniref:Outer membrane protein assembly factor BamB n=1 Tax=Tahibacter aquaticus TaxID=520092 RepID=A0A4R6YNH7_9GAMM|nr:outer membrane protein assembly factor BamB [Tahibacter aquaticus]TDR39187.1 Beta-barrel assembly machine subunit BamB [Tahibacter aquaticus]